MNTLRSLILGLLLALALGASVSSPAQAQSVDVPVSNVEIVAGVSAGWGWYPIISGQWYWDWYGYPVYNPYGYSYFDYWGRQPRYATYGAISYSPATDQVGVAWGQYNRFDAASAANNYCGENDCSPVVWVQGGCAAVAKSPDGERVSWGYHAERYFAQDNALRACRYGGVDGCRIGAWVCSY